MINAGRLTIKRVYDPAAPGDGWRVLVDRLWPRGVTRDAAALDSWLKAIAPTPALRSWWRHDPARLGEFATRYRAELDENPAIEDLLEELQSHDRVTLLYAAHDPRVNHAAVLRKYLEDQAD